MADVLRRGLTRAGLAVDVVGLGADALIHAGATEYDAIVLDAMLPDLDGLEVCRRLRAARIWSPVLMLTARARPPAVWPRVVRDGAGGRLPPVRFLNRLPLRVRLTLAFAGAAAVLLGGHGV